MTDKFPLLAIIVKKSSPAVKLRGRPLADKLILFFAFGFGTGFMRPAPGTWGTLPGVFIAAWLMRYHWAWQLAAVITVTVVGVWLCSRASAILGVHDHGGIVIDEIAGVLVTLLFFEPTGLTLLLGFFWFRVFDILKPPPIKWVDEKVPGGLGIMVDDLIAGVFAWGALWLSLWLIPM